MLRKPLLAPVIYGKLRTSKELDYILVRSMAIGVVVGAVSKRRVVTGEELGESSSKGTKHQLLRCVHWQRMAMSSLLDA